MNLHSQGVETGSEDHFWFPDLGSQNNHLIRRCRQLVHNIKGHFIRWLFSWFAQFSYYNLLYEYACQLDVDRLSSYLLYKKINKALKYTWFHPPEIKNADMSQRIAPPLFIRNVFNNLQRFSNYKFMSLRGGLLLIRSGPIFRFKLKKFYIS